MVQISGGQVNGRWHPGGARYKARKVSGQARSLEQRQPCVPESRTPWSNSLWARGMSLECASHYLLCDWSRFLPSNLGKIHSSSSLGGPSTWVIKAGMGTVPQAIPHCFLQCQNTPRRIKPSPEGDCSLWAGWACHLLCCHVQSLNCCSSSGSRPGPRGE